MEPIAIQGGVPVRDVTVCPWPQWPIFDEAEERALIDVIRSREWWYVGGAQGRALEQEFANFQDANHGVACTTGSAALEIALRALEIGCGDEVIVPAYTFVATAGAVAMVGATPVFADIQPNTLNIDPVSFSDAITPQTRAVIPVHIAGRPADMDEILEIARKRGLFVIEDAAQAHGAAWRGRRVGALGDLGTFSFQASKNLNSGEGGMVLSNDALLADAAWSVMNVGREREGRWYEHRVLGSNYRMTEFQSTLLRVQLRRLPEQIERREANAAHLRAFLPHIPGLSLPTEDTRITCHAYHLFTVRLDLRRFGNRSLTEVVAALEAEGIPCSDGYVPLYREPMFARLAARQGGCCRAGRRIDYTALSLAITEQVCADCLWIPQFTLLAEQSDMEDIAEAFARVQRSFDSLPG